MLRNVNSGFAEFDKKCRFLSGHDDDGTHGT